MITISFLLPLLLLIGSSLSHNKQLLLSGSLTNYFISTWEPYTPKCTSPNCNAFALSLSLYLSLLHCFSNLISIQATKRTEKMKKKNKNKWRNKLLHLPIDVMKNNYTNTVNKWKRNRLAFFVFSHNEKTHLD